MEPIELRRKVREFIAASFHYHDYYSDLAKEIFGDDFTKEHRDAVKTATFSVLYGYPGYPGEPVTGYNYGILPIALKEEEEEEEVDEMS